MVAENEKTINGVRDFQKVSLVVPSSGDEFSGDDIFYALHLAIETVRNESLEGVDVDIVLCIVSELTHLMETLYDIKNELRSAKGKRDLTVAECAAELGHVCKLVLKHPNCDCVGKGE